MGLASKIKIAEASSGGNLQQSSPPAQYAQTPSAPPLYAGGAQQQAFYGGAYPSAPANPHPHHHPKEQPYAPPYAYPAPSPHAQPPTSPYAGQAYGDHAQPPYAGQAYRDQLQSSPSTPYGKQPYAGQAYGEQLQSSPTPPYGKQPYGESFESAPHSQGTGYPESQPNYMPYPQASGYPQYANSTSNSMDVLAQKLQSIIQSNGLQRFYDPARLQAVVQKVASINFDKVAAQWKIAKELAYDLAPLALYDIVFYCDDSGSMAFEENGERINDLKYILSQVSGIATMFDDDGIMVRFMNSNVNGDGIRSAADVEQLMSQVRFSGATPLGTNLDRKVIQPFVLGQATSNTSKMAKPVLVIVITDGEPYGESRDTIVQVIRHAKDTLARSPYGSGALAVQIAQVGKDAKTQKFLESLDKDPVVGRMIDCTSYYEMEEEEFARRGVTLTPELWLLKMCVGAIDPEYDSKDD